MITLSLRARYPVCIGSRRFEPDEEYCRAVVPDEDVGAHLRATLTWEAFAWSVLPDASTDALPPKVADKVRKTTTAPADG